MTLEHGMNSLDLDAELVEIKDLKVDDLLDFARYGEFEALKAILDSEHSLKLALCDENKISLLHMVAANGHLECAELLLKNPQVRENCLNSCNTEGNTPLHWAALNAHSSLVRLLLEHGADINIKNYADCSPFDEAVVREKFEITAVMIEFLEKNQDSKQSSEVIVDSPDQRNQETIESPSGEDNGEEIEN
jgi:uncharacterized protein